MGSADGVRIATGSLGSTAADTMRWRLSLGTTADIPEEASRGGNEFPTSVGLVDRRWTDGPCVRCPGLCPELAPTVAVQRGSERPARPREADRASASTGQAPERCPVDPAAGLCRPFAVG